MNVDLLYQYHLLMTQAAEYRWMAMNQALVSAAANNAAPDEPRNIVAQYAQRDDRTTTVRSAHMNNTTPHLLHSTRLRVFPHSFVIIILSDMWERSEELFWRKPRAPPAHSPPSPIPANTLSPPYPLVKQDYGVREIKQPVEEDEVPSDATPVEMLVAQTLQNLKNDTTRTSCNNKSAGISPAFPSSSGGRFYDGASHVCVCV